MRAMKNSALASFVAVLLACMTLTTLCTPREPPRTTTGPVDIHDLMIDASVFPRGWQVWHGPGAIPERERGERDSLYVVFHYEGLEPTSVGAHQAMFRYADGQDAANVYSAFCDDEFLPWNMVTPWAVPEEWSYESPVADRFRFACGEKDFLGPYWTCKAVGQYGTYISLFTTDLSPDYMRLEDIERIMAGIDERMAFYVEENTE